MKYTQTLFDEIKTAYANDTKQDSSFKDIMKFKAGNTYQVRLVPDVAEPRKTIYHYFHHSWNSKSTGMFVTTLCPSSYGEACPIDNYVLKTYRNGSEAEKEANKIISRKESWMVKVYVISDPTDPENNGKVKVVRYGRELAKIIDSAMSGEDADEFGTKIFDIKNGCTLRIKCESKSAKGGKTNYTTYVSSKFLAASSLDEITDEKLQEIYSNSIDLMGFNKKKTGAELQRLLDEHFFCISDVDSKEEEGGDDADSGETHTTSSSNTADGVKNEEPETDDDTDAKLKALLEGLN